jgi:formylglycine-generating enzyme required for sulfatase activity
MRIASVAGLLKALLLIVPGLASCNAYGLHDVVGNMRELTQDGLTGSYFGADRKAAPQLGGREQHAVLGGSSGRASRFLRAATRGVINSIRLVQEL